MTTPKHLVIQPYKHIYSTEINKIVSIRIRRTKDFIEKAREATIAFEQWVTDHPNNNSCELLEMYQNYLSELTALNKAYYIKPKIGAYKTLNEKFRSEKCQLCKTIATRIEEPQSELNYDDLPSDKKIHRFIKRGKSTALRIKKRVHRNKEIVPTRNVPLRLYTYYHFIVLGCADMWLVLSNILDIENKSLKHVEVKIKALDNLFYQSDETMSHEDIVKSTSGIIQFIDESSRDIDQKCKELPQIIDTCFKRREDAFNKDYYKLGTFELRTRVIKKNIREQESKERQKVQKKFQNYETTMFGLSETLSLNMELYKVKNSALAARELLNTGHVKEVLDKTVTSLSKIKDKVADIKEIIENKEAQHDELQENLSKYRLELNEMLKNEALKLSYKTERGAFVPQLIEDILKTIASSITDIAPSRMIPKPESNRKKPEVKKLIEVQPREMLRFKIYPLLTSKINKIKESARLKLDAYDVSIIDFAHFIDYNFDTAELLADDGAPAEKESKEISKEGLELAVQKISQSIETIESIYNDVQHSMKEELLHFIDSVIDLTNRENIEELRLRIIKARAVSITVQARDTINQSAERFLLWAKQYFGWLQIWSSGVTGQIVDIYYQKDQSGSVNTEISNFLTETRARIGKLPFLYKRLFKLEPIDSGYLFCERDTELNALIDAYKQWRLGRFATVVAIAEKGAGITSLLQNLLSTIPYEQRTIKFADHENMHKEEVIIEEIASALCLKKSNCIDDVVEQLNSHPEKLIITADGLQNIFLRKVDGFKSLPIFFEIISRTNGNVFWISTCTQHAWDYLKKFMHIHDYFGYVVQFGEFSNDEMIDIVTTRHKVSGYDLEFLPSSADTESKKFNKLDKTQQQEELRRQFFKQLNALSHGNITVAFVFWLRSTNGIHENVLKIKSLSDFDGTFIKKLDVEKLFCLHAFLLHDNLNVDEFCKVMRYPTERGKLLIMQMVDDGLLIKTKKRFMLNTLLYRSTITALKAHNILH